MIKGKAAWEASKKEQHQTASQ